MRFALCTAPGCTALVVGGTRCLHHAKHGEHAELLALIENGSIPAVACPARGER